MADWRVLELKFVFLCETRIAAIVEGGLQWFAIMESMLLKPRTPSFFELKILLACFFPYKVSAWYALCQHAESLHKAQSMLAKVENYDKSAHPQVSDKRTYRSDSSLGRLWRKKTFLSNIFSTATVCLERRSRIESRCSISLKFLHQYINSLCKFVAYDLTTLFGTMVTQFYTIRHICPHTLYFTSGQPNRWNIWLARWELFIN